MPISVRQQHTSRIPLKRLQAALSLVSRDLRLAKWDVHFLYVSDRAIRVYNRRYLRHDYVTDVIAFEMKEEGVLGDIVVSADTARRQAKEQGHSAFTELTILSIHGLLHLLGYRDKRKKDRDAMWRETDRLLAVAGGGA